MKSSPRFDTLGFIAPLAAAAFLTYACAANEEPGDSADGANGVPGAQPFEVDPSHFLAEAIVGEITKEERQLVDGTMAVCYVFQTAATPSEHEMGPWCPTNATDEADMGGIWFQDGEVYNVDGAFIAGLAEFYGDPAWDMVREDGTIRVTDTPAAFNAAARPDVDPEYQNHCVAGRPEWFQGGPKTFVIPVQPIMRERSTPVGRSGVGVAFNGVNFDPPAPVHAILGAHTIAPLDDAGGHINPHAGYHYHAATGATKEIAQADGHAPMIGYALDGFALYAHADPGGVATDGIDECGGHKDSIRGYHYHVGSAGSNRIIGAFRGVAGTMSGDH